MTSQCEQFDWCLGHPAASLDTEHYCQIGTTPATLTTCVTLDGFDTGGVTYPSVNTGISFSETEDPMPFIWLHIQGGRRDEDIGMNILEAVRLVDHLKQAIIALQDSLNFTVKRTV